MSELREAWAQARAQLVRAAELSDMFYADLALQRVPRSSTATRS